MVFPTRKIFFYVRFFILFYRLGKFSLTTNFFKTQAHWSIALSLSFKFIVGYSAVQPFYRGPQCRSTSPLSFAPDSSWQSPRSASLSFPMCGIHIECVSTFLFLYRISCKRESFHSSSCAAYIAD